MPPAPVFSPTITVRRVGREGQPVAIVDGFHPDPHGLRPLPPDCLGAVGPALAAVLRDVLGGAGDAALIDASFSIVTVPPVELTPPQRLPHVDALEPDRVALVHYLSPAGGGDDGGGTSFYRHRSMGFETISAARGRAYADRLRRDLKGVPPPANLLPYK